MFSGIGIYDLMHAPHWQKCSNTTVRSRLTAYIRERNQIAHGKKLTIHRPKVIAFKRYVVLLADALDAEVRRQIQDATGNQPW